jgi:hypothetical protein
MLVEIPTAYHPAEFHPGQEAVLLSWVIVFKNKGQGMAFPAA